MLKRLITITALTLGLLWSYAVARGDCGKDCQCSTTQTTVANVGKTSTQNTKSSAPIGKVESYSAPTVSGNDFLNSLNGARARLGLKTLVYDNNLSQSAAQNNPHMTARQCSGHYVVDPSAWQVSLYAPGFSADAALQVFMGSAAHAGILLAPGALSIGVAFDGFSWTANLRSTPSAGSPTTGQPYSGGWLRGACRLRCR
jgi:uncharacterized protein YkwD